MREVGRLVGKYLAKISPDHGLGVSRFLAIAESLPDSARVFYDGVYKAWNIYLEVIQFESLKIRLRKRTILVVLFEIEILKQEEV
jgi:hypothetical protein